MNRTAIARIIIPLILIGGVVSLGVHYDLQEDNHDPYPDSTDLKISPGEYVDRQVFVFGIVEELSEEQNAARIRIETDEGPFTAEITRFSTQNSVQSGGTVQVYGVFEGEYLIQADNVRVVNPAGSSKVYKYVASVVAAVLVMILFFRYWRLNIQTLGFKLR
ncbi:hypothetical protein [Haloquadratum walsbyi]|jgi:hypothetical protein|uniref:Uncharacterized protein n=1 Tax=Haloquadratum walsbyi J07HQW2 TaxID=1238425 RepID=U1MXM6_9EURY|nr:hypothetical protein [Haloquadratum walsbyi]ERG95234.1 MAG: hypothetical protein J07HQW2_01683 [Haloquadratum walsbyi J07HQW2]